MGTRAADDQLDRDASTAVYHFAQDQTIDYPQTLSRSAHEALGARAPDERDPRRMHFDVRKLLADNHWIPGCLRAAAAAALRCEQHARSSGGSPTGHDAASTMR